MENKKDIKGASIVIALSMIAAIMFFTIGMASTMILAIQNTSDSKKAVQAEYAAQSGVELANLTLRDMDIAKSGSLPDSNCFNPPTCTNKVDYTITRTDPSLTYSNPYSSYRSLPIRGYGNAASSCVNSGNADDPCNWNKIYYGDSVDVPLYFITPYGAVINVGNIMTELFVRVRAPCIEGFATACNRYNIETSQADPVLNWQFIGESCVNTSCLVGPKATSFYISGDSIRLNATGGYKVLKISDLGEDSVNPDVYNGTIQSFLKNEPPWSLTDKNNNIVKPKLKLSYVKALLGPNPSTVPYLEYQILYLANGYPLSSMYLVTVTGQASGFKFKLNGVQGLNSGLFDFAVQN